VERGEIWHSGGWQVAARGWAAAAAAIATKMAAEKARCEIVWSAVFRSPINFSFLFVRQPIRFVIRFDQRAARAPSTTLQKQSGQTDTTTPVD